MKKLFIVMLMSVVPYFCHAQIQNESVPVNSANVTVIKNAVPVKSNDPSIKSVITDNDQPKDQKIAPSTFFIINDKPVTREEYMKHLAEESKKSTPIIKE